MLAIQLPAVGGPDAFRRIDTKVPTPGPGEILVRQKAVGLNYIDIYHRLGQYPVELPGILGIEGAGTVEAIGAGVTRFKVGDRVAYGGPLGAYAEARLIPETAGVRIPPTVDVETAAAAILKGLTADALLTAYRVKPGDTCLVWAAAGGVGTILCQWAKTRGARVIGVVGGEDKKAHALSHGCDAVLDHKVDDIAAQARALTDGRGVSVVYDGVGKSSLQASINSLAMRGMLVSYGNASGPPPQVDLLALGRAGSLSMTRIVVYHFHQTPVELDHAASALFDAIGSGAIKVAIGQRFALKDVDAAHRSLEGSQTVGSTLLIP